MGQNGSRQSGVLAVETDAALAEALERALGRLYMVFQPIVSWAGREVIAYEALVRTEEPSLARPDLLFSAAERLNSIALVGRMIRAAVADMVELAPEAASVFVNVHGGELADDELYRPTAPLSRVASRVVLEITERWSLDRFHDVRERIAALRALGFRIAVDDLGAGYAGLTSFARLRPEVVKLDMSLIRGVNEDPTRQHLIRSLNDVCHDLGIRVVAEGVETREERDVLIALGSDLLQGYLFSKPAAPFPEVNRAGWEVSDTPEHTASRRLEQRELVELRDSLSRLLASLASAEGGEQRVVQTGELGALGLRTLRSLDSVLAASEDGPTGIRLARTGS